MAVLNIYNLAGEQTGTVEVNDAVFGIEPNKVVLHEVLTAELAAARQGTASTKTRAMVRGGGRKPFKQKGTGRARQGTIRAPHMVGGGVTFGPHPRSYEKKVNKKVRNLALRSALSAKVAAGELVVLEDVSIETPKTKVIVNLVNKIDAKQKQLFVVRCGACLECSVFEELSGESVHFLIAVWRSFQVGITSYGVRFERMLEGRVLLHVRQCVVFADRQRRLPYQRA